MPRIASPIHDKTVPKRVSKPTVTAEAAATVAESAVAPAKAARKTRAAKPKATPAAKAKASKPKAAPAVKKAVATKAKAAPARKVKAATEAASPAPTKPAKVHKPKLVRDSFTIPKDEYAVLESLKARALGLGQHVRKSELLRAGIQALNAMNERAFVQAVGAVPTLKTGRPKKG